MTVAGKQQVVSFPAGSTAVNLDDPDTVRIDVPAGEIWYVDVFTYGPDETGGNPVPTSYKLGVADDNDIIGSEPTIQIHNASGSRSVRNGSPNTQRDSSALGWYVYGGEAIYVGMDGLDNACDAKVNARQVV